MTYEHYAPNFKLLQLGLGPRRESANFLGNRGQIPPKGGVQFGSPTQVRPSQI